MIMIIVKIITCRTCMASFACMHAVLKSECSVWQPMLMFVVVTASFLSYIWAGSIAVALQYHEVAALCYAI